MCYYLYILSSFVFIVFTKQTSNQEANKRKINCILITLNFAVFFSILFSTSTTLSLSLSLSYPYQCKCSLEMYFVTISHWYLYNCTYYFIDNISAVVDRGIDYFCFIHKSELFHLKDLEVCMQSFYFIY